MKQTITVYIPSNGSDYIDGCLNGQNFRIKTGEPVEVPLNLAAIILDSRRAVTVGQDAVAAYRQAGGKRLM